MGVTLTQKLRGEGKARFREEGGDTCESVTGRSPVDRRGFRVRDTIETVVITPVWVRWGVSCDVGDRVRREEGRESE